MELKFGVRLPPPQFCPLSIAEIVKQCFHEDPHERPSFERLKISMTEICSSLNGKSNASPDRDSCDSVDLGVTYADIEMKERYFNLKEKNKDIKILTYPGEIFSKRQKRHKSLPTVSSTQSCNHLYMFKPIIHNSKGC